MFFDIIEVSVWDLSKAKVQRRETRVVVILEPKAIGSMIRLVRDHHLVGGVKILSLLLKF